MFTKKMKCDKEYDQFLNRNRYNANLQLKLIIRDIS